MTNPVKKIWDDLKMISQTQQGRQALLSSGSVIAAAYLGYIGPDLFIMMHDTLAFYSAKYPFLNPTDMAASLWDGAKYFSAAVVDVFGGIADSFGIDISHNIREAMTNCREFLSRYGDRTVDASRAFIEDVSVMVGSQLSAIAGRTGAALTAGWTSIKEVWAPALVVLGAAKEAFEYFEIGKKVYAKYTSWGKKSSSQEKDVEQNLEVNTAIAGDAALDTAEKTARDLPEGRILNANRKDILWISDQLHRHLNEDSSRMPRVSRDHIDGMSSPQGYRPSHDTRPTSLSGTSSLKGCQIDVDILLKKPSLSSNPVRLSQIRLEIDDTTDKLRPNWDDSALSAERLNGLRKTPGMVRDISKSDAFIKGGERRIITLDGLRAEAMNDNNYDSGPDDGPSLI